MADLLKEAIADAKAVRETAIANAKLALEEAFTPKLQSMLSARINEQGELDDEEDEESEEMTEQGMEMPEMPMDSPEDEEEEEDENSDLELESIIRELEGDDEDEEEEELSMEQATSTNIGSNDNSMNQANGNDTLDPEGTPGGIGTAALQGSDLLEQDEEDEDDESLEEVLRSLREEDGEEHEDEEEAEEMMETRYVAHAYENKLREAYGAISFLRGKINEVNLLNAKLLFSNKLFRAGSLNENQKLRVIDTFDRAKSLREVKLVYSTLAESFKPAKSGAKLLSRKPITEGIPAGYASRPSGTTRPRQVITEGQIQASRFQKLAGLLK